MNIKVLIPLAIFCFVTIGYSQTFPDNREKFCKQFLTVTSQSSSESEQEFIKKDLTPYFINPQNIDDNTFQQIVTTANLMDTKHYRFYPDIFQYVQCSYLFSKNKINSNNYTNWHKILTTLLDGKSSTKAREFLDFSSSFLSEGELTGGSNFSWKYIGGTFTVNNDKEPSFNLTGGRLLCVLDNRGGGKNKTLIDSVVIYNTKGEFQPLKNVFEGNGGKVNWVKVGEDPTKLFAEFTSKYQVNTKLPTIKIDSVSLTTPKFQRKIMGTLSDRAYNINRDADRNNPQFRSYEKSLLIKNFIDGVDFVGAFRYEGADFIGSGIGNSPAKLTITRKGKPFATIYANQIINSTKTMYANDAAIVIHLSATDSITQPGLFFNYIKNTKTFEFSRNSNGGNSAPFSSNYYQLDMFVPKLTWKQDSDSLKLTYGQELSEASRVASLESKDFFSEDQFLAMQGMSNINPLVSLYNYCYKYDNFNIDEATFATAIGRTTDQSKDLMVMLSSLNFISWNPNTHKVIVQDKVKKFIDAHKKIVDYDNITFTSDLRVAKMPAQYTDDDISKSAQLQEMNALIQEKNKARKNIRDFGVINLNTLALNLNAVERVNLSDKSFTFIVPDNDQLTVLKNRDINFKGWVRTGKLEINVRDGKYDYAKNQVNLTKTDKTIISVNSREPNKNTPGQPQFIFLNSFISGATGILYVDLPNNRSGNNKGITNFPRLDIQNHAKIYYNDRSIQRGSYDSTRFYYVMDPIVIDSLDNFKDANLKLNGELISAGIFPKFREQLRVMPDYSLGFSKDAPKEGYPFYETKAMYQNKIVLSNQGLQGSGKIDFIKSTSESAQFTFLPDSAIGIAKFTNSPVETGVQFPDILGTKVQISYNPRKQYLNVYTLDEPVNMFKDIKYTGLLTLRATGITGYGNLMMPDANLRSRKFEFKRWIANADTSDFNLKNKYADEGENALSLVTVNVNASLDFKNRVGDFKSNKGTTKTNFPLNNFYCIMDSYKWYMDKEDITLEKAKQDINIDAGLNLATSNFFTTDPKKDSLNFRVPRATFSLKEKTISCSKMDYVDIADARIFPNDGKLNIRKKGKIDELENAKITANFITKYFTFEDASVQINTGKDYTAKGKYRYVNAARDTSLISMDKIYVDSVRETRAIGVIPESDSFQLSKQFDYYGNIHIVAANPQINFDGSVKVNHSCSNFARSWMAFKAPIDPKNIRIPIAPTMKTRDGDIVTTGLIWRDSKSPDSVRIYPAFLSKMQSPSDIMLMNASGFLQYDSLAKEFQISTAEKLTNREDKGNYLSLHLGSCSLNGDGKINLGMDYGNVEVTNYGVINYNSKTALTTMNITSNFKFPVLDQATFEKWGSKIADDESLQPLDLSNSTLIQAILEMKDKATADETKNEYIQKGKVKKLPNEFTDGITFTGIQLKSYNNGLENGLITSLNYASLVNVYNKIIFKQIPFKAYFKKVYSGNVSGDKFQIDMDIPGLGDYFFDLGSEKKKVLLQIYTSDSSLKSDIDAKKEDARKARNFQYQSTDNSGIMGNFIRLF